MLLPTFSAMAANAWASVPPAYSTAAQITPPALAMKSGTTSTPRSASSSSASAVAGRLAPGRITLARTSPALAAVNTSGRAAGIHSSQARPTSSSGGTCSPPGNNATESPASLKRTSFSTSRPSGLTTAPLLSEAATRTAPRSASSSAARRPTAPNPCTTMRAPSIRWPLTASTASAATARPYAVAPSSSMGIPPRTRGRPTALPISSRTQAMAVSSRPMSGPGT